MKKSTLFIMLFIFSMQLAFSQHPSWQDTISLSIRDRGFLKDPIRSKWKSNVKKEGDYWVLSLFDKQKIMQEQIQFKDEDLTERAGPYNAYQNGVLKVSGIYDKGYKHGTWQYFDSNSKLIERCSFAYDKPHGLHETFWKNGNKRRMESYDNSVLQGEFSIHYPNGELALQEYYLNGVLKEPGKYLDREGHPVDKQKIYTAINYPGGLDKFKQEVNQKLSAKHFPKKKKDYSLVLRISTNAAGEIVEVDCPEPVSDSFNKEVILAIKNMKKMTPATEFGRPIASFIMLPISLSKP